MKRLDRDSIARILAAHQAWLASNGKDGMRANFTDADLRLSDLSGHDLSRALLNGANLERANLAGACLDGAELRNASLLYADLANARACRADLRGADLTFASLAGIVADEALLHHASLASVDARRASFRGAAASRASFANANLASADFAGAEAIQTFFTMASAPRAIFAGADVRRSNFQGANLLSADIAGLVYAGASFDSAALLPGEARELAEYQRDIAARDEDTSDVTGEIEKAIHANLRLLNQLRRMMRHAEPAILALTLACIAARLALPAFAGAIRLGAPAIALVGLLFAALAIAARFALNTMRIGYLQQLQTLATPDPDRPPLPRDKAVQGEFSPGFKFDTPFDHVEAEG